MTELRPIVYQIKGDQRIELAAQYVLLDDFTFGFVLSDNYDPQLALVIDPTLTFSTYLGGTDVDLANSVDVGDDGSVYVAGITR